MNSVYLCAALAAMFTFFQFSHARSQSFYLDLLKITQSNESKDYLTNKTQFQLHSLLTEQSHNITQNLSAIANSSQHILAIKQLLYVDRDITMKIRSMLFDDELKDRINKCIKNVKHAISTGKLIYIYGTGSTGRLAKQIENFWITFWEAIQNNEAYLSIKNKLSFIPQLDSISQRVIGVITGGDRALIKSLEGFEDLLLIGKLQLEDHHITADDIVFAVTEGGETSAVIGTILEAAKESSKDKRYFVYNNPDNLLLKFNRSRIVLENENITKINFATGPQAITGSTRMQATTSQTFLVASIIEMAITEIFVEKLSKEELMQINFYQNYSSIEQVFSKFFILQRDIEELSDSILHVSLFEYQAYMNDSRSYYFGSDLITTLFIDVTERAPTFSLAPLDSIKGPFNSWVKVITNAMNLNSAWHVLLKKEFQGLDKGRYSEEFNKHIEDPYLKEIALQSLNYADNAQKLLYDFSIKYLLRENITLNSVGIAYVTIEEAEELLQIGSLFRLWITKQRVSHCKIAIVVLGLKSQENRFAYFRKAISEIPGTKDSIFIEEIRLSTDLDPMKIQIKLGLKMYLNAQSTFIMAKLERVLGNSMIYVMLSNLKLIGRATFLTQLHINRIKEYPLCKKLKDYPDMTYDEANAILYNAKDYLKQIGDTLTPVIPLSLIRLLQAMTKSPCTWEECISIYNIEKYISRYIARICLG